MSKDNNDLDHLIKEFYSREIISKRKDEDIENLKKEVESLQQQRNDLERVAAGLRNEATELAKVVSGFEATISKLAKNGVENKNLLKERDEMKNLVSEINKENENKVNNLMKNIASLEKCHQMELKKAAEEFEEKKQEEISVLLDKLKEKGHKICELEDFVNKFDATVEEEKLKLKIEYEEKIELLKLEVSNNKQCQPTTTKCDDIFRKKYQKLEIQYKTDIETLQNELKNLKSIHASRTVVPQLTNPLCFDNCFSKNRTINEAASVKKTLPTQSYKRAGGIHSKSLVNTEPTPKKNKQNRSLSKLPIETGKKVNGNLIVDEHKQKTVVKRRKLFNSELGVSFNHN